MLQGFCFYRACKSCTILDTCCWKSHPNKRSVGLFNRNMFCTISDDVFILAAFFKSNFNICKTFGKKLNKICLSKIYIYRKFNIGRLELVLIARRFLFEKISIMLKGYSSQLKGVLCNIPIDVINVCNTLPRPADSKVIIIVKVKRR